MKLVLLSLLWACGGAAPEPATAAPGPSASTAAPEAAGAPRDIDVATLKGKVDAGATFVLDVRTPGEFAQGHVPGAVNITMQELPARLSELEPHKGKDIAVICAVGGRSDSATSFLREKGYGTASNVLGGTQAWVRAGYPLE